MLKKLLSLVAAVLLSVSLAGSALAEMVKGKVSKVEDGGRTIVVKSKDGKEVSVKISGSRTQLEGIGDRSEFKEGQSVSADVEGGEAKKVKVSK